MSNCVNTLTDILKGCELNAGGIKIAYLIPESFVTGYTQSGGTVTAVGLSGSSKFSTFEFNSQTGTLSETPTIDLVNGTTFFEQSITLRFSKREVTKRNAIKVLIAGQPNLVAIIKDANDLYWIFGLDENYLNVTAGNFSAGQNRTDFNGYEITMTAQSSELAYNVNPSIIAGLI